MEAADFPVGWSPYLWNGFQFPHNSWKHRESLSLGFPGVKVMCLKKIFFVQVCIKIKNYSHLSHNSLTMGKRRKKFWNYPYLLWKVYIHWSFNFSKSQVLQNDMTCARKCCYLAAVLQFKQRTPTLPFNSYCYFPRIS